MRTPLWRASNKAGCSSFMPSGTKYTKMHVASLKSMFSTLSWRMRTYNTIQQMNVRRNLPSFIEEIKK